LSSFKGCKDPEFYTSDNQQLPDQVRKRHIVLHNFLADVGVRYHYLPLKVMKNLIDAYCGKVDDTHLRVIANYEADV
jgi:hypothetical protein